MDWILSSSTTISGFYGARQEIAHKRQYELHADEPPILAGNDDGANPVEHLLHALASCVTTSMVAHAAVKGISIDELEADLEEADFKNVNDNFDAGNYSITDNSKNPMNAVLK